MLIMKKGIVDSDMKGLDICKYMGWSWDQYLNTPNIVLEKLDIKMEAEREFQKIPSTNIK